jgi:hypothetical protein
MVLIVKRDGDQGQNRPEKVWGSGVEEVGRWIGEAEWGRSGGDLGRWPGAG